MNKQPWYVRLTITEFESSTANTSQSLAFMKEAKKWLKDFCVNRRYTNFKFGIGHFYFSAFFKVREQWWYVSSGDLRWSFGTMLVRTANSDKDYTGGRNQSVYYNENFEANLYKIVKGD